MCMHQNHRIKWLEVAWLNGNIAVGCVYTCVSQLSASVICHSLQVTRHRRWNLYLKARLSSQASSRVLWMQDVHLILAATVAFQDTRAFVSLKKKKERTISSDVINDLICLLLRGVSRQLGLDICALWKRETSICQRTDRNHRLYLSFYESSFNKINWCEIL